MYCSMDLQRFLFPALSFLLVLFVRALHCLCTREEKTWCCALVVLQMSHNAYLLTKVCCRMYTFSVVDLYLLLLRPLPKQHLLRLLHGAGAARLLQQTAWCVSCQLSCVLFVGLDTCMASAHPGQRFGFVVEMAPCGQHPPMGGGQSGHPLCLLTPPVEAGVCMVPHLTSCRTAGAGPYWRHRLEGWSKHVAVHPSACFGLWAVTGTPLVTCVVDRMSLLVLPQPG
jgi:hypothetical protein